MEKTSFEPHTGTIASHFSHPHPLKLIIYKQTLTLTSPCSGCKLKPSGMLYSCTICNYYLHKNCFEMPRQMTHPSHKKRALSLLPKPAYGDRHFICDACGEKGKGFTYHCKPCGLDLHMLCAIMPLSFTYEFHMHKLHLTFQSPYPDNKFSCDICHTPGTCTSRHWLYRCKTCGFDAHLNCARDVPPVGSTLPRQQNIMPKPKPVVIISLNNNGGGIGSGSIPSAPPVPMMTNAPHHGFPGVPIAPPFGTNGQINDFALFPVNCNNPAMAIDI